MGEEQLCWDDLRYLEALGRLGTAGRAARELGVSASTVYRRVSQLEKAVGTSCLQSGEGRLTAAGEALAGVARQTNTALGVVSRDLRSSARSVAGEVSLTTVEGVIPLLAAPLATLCQRHPELTLRLDVGYQGPSVRRREVDLAIGVMPSPPESLWGRRLFTIRYRVYATAAARAAQPRRWIVVGGGLKTTQIAAWETQHAAPIVMTTNSIQAKMRLVSSGLGVAALPERLGKLDPSLSELEEYRPLLLPLERSAWLLTHPELRDVPRVRAVMDLIVDAFDEQVDAVDIAASAAVLVEPASDEGR